MNRGQKSPILLTILLMISEEFIKSIILQEIKNSDLFLIDVMVSASKKINVFVDGMNGITVKNCASLSMAIEKNIDQENDDYELEVSSPGLDKPLKLHIQYEKNLGRVLDIITKDGNKITGELIKVSEDCIEIKTKKKEKKKKELVLKNYVFDFSDIKSAKVVVQFN